MEGKRETDRLWCADESWYRQHAAPNSLKGIQAGVGKVAGM